MRFEKQSSLPSLINTLCIAFVLIVITVFRMHDAAVSEERWQRVDAFLADYKDMHQDMHQCAHGEPTNRGDVPK